LSWERSRRRRAAPALATLLALRLAGGAAEPGPLMDLATRLVVRESTAPR